MAKNATLVLDKRVESSILLIRGEKVILSTELAALYDVQPRALIQAVKRNLKRFPRDFMFPLKPKEWQNLKSQFVISRWGGSRRAAPYAFTEQGVAMLSSVLKSERAVAVNIAIMRAFVRLREIMTTHRDLQEKLTDLERRLDQHDEEIAGVFEAIRVMLQPPPVNKKKMGFQIIAKASS